MEPTIQPPHPDNHVLAKSTIEHIIDWTFPVVIFLFYFLFYNSLKFTPSEMIRNTGLVAVFLLSTTLIIGPSSRFIKHVNLLKIHRKAWGISSMIFAFIHFFLVFSIYSKFNFFSLLSPNKARFVPYMIGLTSLLILVLITSTSIKFIFNRLNPHTWKGIQATSYIALFLAIIHFYLAEQEGGVFTLYHILEHGTYWFGIVAIVFRLAILFIPKKPSVVHPTPTPQPPQKVI